MVVLSQLHPKLVSVSCSPHHTLPGAPCNFLTDGNFGQANVGRFSLNKEKMVLIVFSTPQQKLESSALLGLSPLRALSTGFLPTRSLPLQGLL